MLIRRCTTLFLDSREDVCFSLDALLTGGDGLIRRLRWVAFAPHVQEEIEISSEQAQWLGSFSPSVWRRRSELSGLPDSDIDWFLENGILLGDPDLAGWAVRHARLQGAHWHPIASVLHGCTRWSGVDTVKNMQDTGTSTGRELRDVLGAPPPEAADRSEDAISTVVLPRWPRTDFDRFLERRTTCRNFDATRPVPLVAFARIMQRVFGAQSQAEATQDTVFLKKNVPSGGGLHPIEAYIVVQNVDSIEPGLYHYHVLEHRIDRLADPAVPLKEFVMQVVAQQHWFADAHVLVILSPRFERTFWKYRRHSKSYRVVAMEAGHLSQMLYLAATDDKLGAFITAAINEIEIEEALGLDSLREGVLAVCGFGWRASVMETAELDPAGRVWPDSTRHAPST